MTDWTKHEEFMEKMSKDPSVVAAQTVLDALERAMDVAEMNLGKAVNAFIDRSKNGS